MKPQRRWGYFRELGCIACIIEGERRGEDRRGTPSDVHHEVHGYRTGDDRTIPLCPWHHRAVPPGQLRNSASPSAAASLLIGPSLALGTRAFTDRYGTFDALWTRVEAEIQRIVETEGGEPVP